MSDETLNLKVVTPSGLALEQQVSTVVLKGELGEFGILAGHVPLVSTVIPGLMTYEGPEGSGSLIIHGGMSEVRDNAVTVLTKAVESPGNVDVSEATGEAADIERRLENGSLTDEERRELTRRLMIARARAGL